MTLEETLNAVREYRDRCSNRNSENHTSEGIEIDSHTLAWIEYWLTWMSEKLVFEAPIIDGWISVKDKLPEKNGMYIVFSESPICRSMLFANFAKDLQKIDKNAFYGMKHPGWYEYDSEWGYCELNYITHWMPRPEPPKGE